jgi:hypothetical protein
MSSDTRETPTLPSTALSRLTDGYGIRLDPIGARLVVIGQLVDVSPKRKVNGGGFLMFKQPGWNTTSDGRTFWDGGCWHVHVAWNEDGKRQEMAATGASPEDALTSLEQSLLDEIQDPGILAAAQAAVKKARESREEIPSELSR